MSFLQYVVDGEWLLDSSTKQHAGSDGITNNFIESCDLHSKEYQQSLAPRPETIPEPAAETAPESNKETEHETESNPEPVASLSANDITSPSSVPEQALATDLANDDTNREAVTNLTSAISALPGLVIPENAATIKELAHGPATRDLPVSSLGEESQSIEEPSIPEEVLEDPLPASAAIGEGKPTTASPDGHESQLDAVDSNKISGSGEPVPKTDSAAPIDPESIAISKATTAAAVDLEEENNTDSSAITPTGNLHATANASTLGSDGDVPADASADDALEKGVETVEHEEPVIPAITATEPENIDTKIEEPIAESKEDYDEPEATIEEPQTPAVAKDDNAGAEYLTSEPVETSAEPVIEKEEKRPIAVSLDHLSEGPDVETTPVLTDIAQKESVIGTDGSDKVDIPAVTEGSFEPTEKSIQPIEADIEDPLTTDTAEESNGVSEISSSIEPTEQLATSTILKQDQSVEELKHTESTDNIESVDKAISPEVAAAFPENVVEPIENASEPTTELESVQKDAFLGFQSITEKAPELDDVSSVTPEEPSKEVAQTEAVAEPEVSTRAVEEDKSEEPKSLENIAEISVPLAGAALYTAAVPNTFVPETHTDVIEPLADTTSKEVDDQETAVEDREPELHTERETPLEELDTVPEESIPVTNDFEQPQEKLEYIEPIVENDVNTKSEPLAEEVEHEEPVENVDVPAVSEATEQPIESEVAEPHNSHTIEHIAAITAPIVGGTAIGATVIKQVFAPASEHSVPESVPITKEVEEPVVPEVAEPVVEHEAAADSFEPPTEPISTYISKPEEIEQPKIAEPVFEQVEAPKIAEVSQPFVSAEPVSHVTTQAVKSIVSEPAVSQDAVEIPTTDVEKFDEPIVENSEPEVSEPILENAKVPEVIDETTVPTSSVKVDEPVSESIVPEQVEAPKISEVSEPLISREAVEAEAPEGIDEEIIPTPSDKVKVSEPEIFEPTVSEHVEESETLVTREINTHEDGITEPIGEIPSLQNIDKPQDSIVSIERPSTVDSDDVSYHNAVEHEHETEYVNPHLVEPPVIIRKVEHTEVEGLAPELPVVSSADLDENISAFNSVPSTAELTDYNTASELTSAAVSSPEHSGEPKTPQRLAATNSADSDLPTKEPFEIVGIPSGSPKAQKVIDSSSPKTTPTGLPAAPTALPKLPTTASPVAIAAAVAAVASATGNTTNGAVGDKSRPKKASASLAKAISNKNENNSPVVISSQPQPSDVAPESPVVIASVPAPAEIVASRRVSSGPGVGARNSKNFAIASPDTIPPRKSKFSIKKIFKNVFRLKN